jgi:hypothetical protein
MIFSGQQFQTFRSLLDRLIPKDEEPSACEAGVDVFVADLLAGDAKAEASRVIQGLDKLEAEAMSRFKASFAGISAADQDALITDFESGQDPAFIQAITELCAQGYYGRPGK